jgi:hypothetical protein
MLNPPAAAGAAAPCADTGDAIIKSATQIIPIRLKFSTGSSPSSKFQDVILQNDSKTPQGYIFG